MEKLFIFVIVKANGLASASNTSIDARGYNVIRGAQRLDYRQLGYCCQRCSLVPLINVIEGFIHWLSDQESTDDLKYPSFFSKPAPS